MSDLIPDLEIEAAMYVAVLNSPMEANFSELSDYALVALVEKNINLLTDDDIASLDKRIDGCVKNLFDIANGDY
jgi:hypothetical protein|tara:strand:+ start:70 stop:291 length:222 start_codon:yes stop_codon:yes gene_type:complete